MNHKLIFYVVFLAIAGTVYAQPRYDLGFHGGPLLSTVPGFANSTLWKLSGCGGLAITRRDNKKNYAQLELNYTRKGAYRKPETGNPDKINFSLHYAESALTYRFEKLKISRRGKGGFDVGISYSRLLSPQLRRNGERIFFDPIWSDKYDLSLISGIHIIYGEHIMVRTRVTYSVNPILRRNILPDDIQQLNVLRTHNITVQFGVAFFLRGIYY